MHRRLSVTLIATSFALFFFGGCTARALDLPVDGSVDLANADLTDADFAGVDLSAPDLVFVPPPDLSDPPVPDFGPGVPPPPVDRLVYAHSAEVLYTVDPTSLAVTEIGEFVWPFVADEMTDIAIDRNGNMLGVSETALYAVDPSTARCTFLATLAEPDFDALTFVAGSDTDPSEVLIGASGNDVYRIDPLTGALTQIAWYGSSLSSSGDLVSIEGATYATVSGDSVGNDLLMKLDPLTGIVTEIGDIGVPAVWGLGYWKQQLYGFTAANGIVLIDIHTGAATPVAGTSSVSFYGAGVITSAPTN